MVIDKKEKVCYILEFKRVMERYGGEQEKTKRKAELQQNSLVRGIQKALEGGEWQVILKVFVGGMCGSVEKVFMTNMELLWKVKEIPFENDMYGSCWRSKIGHWGVTTVRFRGMGTE